MKRIAVASSTLNSVGYDSQTMTLELEFTSGDVYQYFDVPVDVHLKLRQSESLGRFFNEQIKESYRFTKL